LGRVIKVIVGREGPLYNYEEMKIEKFYVKI